MASVIESLVFFAVANFKGRRYIRITSIFAMGAVEISPHTDARRNSLLGKIGNKYTTKSALYNKYTTKIYVWRAMQCKRKFVRARSIISRSRCELAL